MHTENSSCKHGCVLDGPSLDEMTVLFMAQLVFFNLYIYNDYETYGSGSEPMNDLSCDTKTILFTTFMHTDHTSCNHGSALDGAVARQGGGSVHCATVGGLNRSISNDETYDSGSETANDLSCTIKTISTLTGMHNDNSSCNHGCVLDRLVTGQVDGSFRGTADGVLNLSIYNDNETYGSGSEPVNALSCDTKIIPTPTVMHF